MVSQDKSIAQYKRNEPHVWAEISMSFVGFLMILVTIAILSKQAVKSAYTKILVNTAILDNIYLLTIMASNTLYLIFDSRILHVQTIMSMIPFVPVTLTAQTAEVYMVGVLMIKMVVAILEPTRYEKWLSELRTTCMVLFVWILSVVYNLPHWLAYMPAMINPNMYNYTWPKLWREENDKFMFSNFYSKIYGLYLLCACEFLIPITIFIAGLVIVHNSQRSQTEDDNPAKSPARRRRQDINKSLYYPIWYIVMASLITRIITACFFIFQGPRYCPEVHACMFGDIIVRLVYISNAFIKFLIYVFFWPSFRHMIHDFLCCIVQPQAEFV